MGVHALAVLAVLAVSVDVGAGLDNGLALRPLMGWRNWISMHKAVNQTVMEAMMHALADRSRLVGGVPTSLADLGYNRIGLDDAWQACGTGVNGSFHDAEGNPLINTTRFPSMKAMNTLAHSLGLKSDWYANNCVCKESQAWPPEYIEKHYRGDAAAIVRLGFDGVKLDSCGQFRNLTRWAAVLNATGVPILVENCHQGSTVPCGNNPGPGACGTNPPGDSPPLGPTEEGFCSGTTPVSNCPYHLFRSSGDVANNWLLAHGNVLTTIKFAGPVPRSRPGAWAYPDTMEVGRLSPAAQSRLLFGLYCITSSPLILGHTLTNASLTDALWPIITNKEAIAVQQTVVPHTLLPGTRLRVWDEAGAGPATAAGGTVFSDVCDTADSTQLGWAFDNVTQLFRGPDGPGGERRCMTTKGGDDLVHLGPCDASDRGQRWVVNASGFVHSSSTWCLAIRTRLDINYGVGVQPCSRPWATFELTAHGQLRSTAATGKRRCLAGRAVAPVDRGESIELWAKPLTANNGTVAVLVANLGVAAKVSFSPSDAAALPSCSRFRVRDVWKQAAVGPTLGLHEPFRADLDTYSSAFVTFACADGSVQWT